jgi:hypothetical protein
MWRKRRKTRIKKKTGMGSRNISTRNPPRTTPTLCNLPCGKSHKHRPTRKNQRNGNPPIENQLIPAKKLEFASTVTRIIQTERKSHDPLEGIVPPKYADYLSVFREKEAVGLPPHQHHDHHIPLLEGKVPPFEPLRALDEDRLQVLRGYLDENEKWGWIRRSTSPAGAPIHFVKNKDGTLRLCVDYRQLNEITIKDHTPLPLIGEVLDELYNAKIYTKLDVGVHITTSGYLQGTNGRLLFVPNMAYTNIE